MSIKNPNPIEKIIGNNLRRIRIQRGWSQETLGDSVDLTFQQIQKYENGTNGMRGSRLVQMANTLNCSIDEFFIGVKFSKNANGRNPVAPEPDPLRELALTARGVRLARAFNAMPSAAQLALINLCNTMNGGNADGDQKTKRPEREVVRIQG